MFGDKFSELAAEADEIISKAGRDFEAFSECAPVFHKLYQQQLYIDALHRILSENLSAGREILPDISFGQFIVLRQSLRASWAIIQHPPKSEGLYLVPNHSLATRISQTPISVTRYALPDSLSIDALSSEVALENRGACEPAAGELIFRNGAREALAIVASPGVPALTLRVNSTTFGEYEWSVNPDTLKPSQIFSMRERESFIVTIMELLKDVGSQSSLPHLDRYTQHPLHFVRWKAVQAIAEIDAELGIQRIRAAADDTSPEVSRAARATLEALA